MPASKDQIADAFERHVQRFGYGKATVEDVAAELGISKKTVYEHFGSKREIYLYVVERIARQMRSEMRRIVAAGETWGEKFEMLLRYVLSGSRQHIVETTKTDWQQEYEVVAEALVKAIGEVMDEVIEGGTDEGEFSFENAKLAERLVGAVMLEYVNAVREDPGADYDEAVIAASRRFLG